MKLELCLRFNDVSNRDETQIQTRSYAVLTKVITQNRIEKRNETLMLCHTQNNPEAVKLQKFKFASGSTEKSNQVCSKKSSKNK